MVRLQASISEHCLALTCLLASVMPCQSCSCCHDSPEAATGLEILQSYIPDTRAVAATHGKGSVGAALTVLVLMKLVQSEQP